MLETTCCLLVAAVVGGGWRLRAAGEQIGDGADETQTALGVLHGTTRGPGGGPLTRVKVVVRNTTDNTDRAVVSDAGGMFIVENLKSGRYELTASREGSAEASPAAAVAVDLAERANLNVDLTLENPTSTCPACTTNFLKRLIKAYAGDWNPKQPPAPDRSRLSAAIPRLSQIHLGRTRSGLTAAPR